MVSAEFFFYNSNVSAGKLCNANGNHSAKVSAEKFYNAKAITAPRISAEETNSSLFIFLFSIIEPENFLLFNFSNTQTNHRKSFAFSNKTT